MRRASYDMVVVNMQMLDMIVRLWPRVAAAGSPA